MIREQMALESEGEPAETEAAPELETVSDALATAERDLANGLLCWRVLGALPPDRIFRGRTRPTKHKRCRSVVLRIGPKWLVNWEWLGRTIEGARPDPVFPQRE